MDWEGFEDEEQSYLFAVLELLHDAVVVLLGDALGIAYGVLDEGLEAALEQLVDLVVVVVVVPDAEHAVYVVPNGPPEARRVDLAVGAHGVVGEVVGRLEFVVQQSAHVLVEGVHQGVAVSFPGEVLDAEGRYVVELAAFGEVLVNEAGVVDVGTEVGVEGAGTAAARRGRKLGRLHLDGLESLGQLLRGYPVGVVALRETLHALHQRLDANLLLEYRRRGRGRRQFICKSRKIFQISNRGGRIDKGLK